MVKGTPVYVSGSVGANPLVFVADAGVATKMPVTYIVNENIDIDEVGVGILLGKIEGVDTTGYSAGTEIFVAVGGGWTDVRPTGSAIIQSLGFVTFEGTGGQGIILNPGPASLPNLPENELWIGDANSYPVPKTINEIGLATTGSNVFFGDQEINGNTETDNIFFYSDASKTGAVQPGQFLTLESPSNQANLIFSNTLSPSGQSPLGAGLNGEIIFSGSNNIMFASNRGTTADRYGILRGNNNIGVFYPTLNNDSTYLPLLSNNFLHGPLNMTLGSGTGGVTFAQNDLLGSFTLNIPSGSRGGAYNSNLISGMLNIEQTLPVTNTVAQTFNNNVVNGSLNMQFNSGSFQAIQNVINGNQLFVTSSYESTGAAAGNGIIFNNNNVAGFQNRILFDGKAVGVKGFNNNFIGGNQVTASMVGDDTNGISNVMVFGQGLYVESGPGSAVGGAAVFGRWNDIDSSSVAQYKFIIGNGTDNANRKTALYLDGSNDKFIFNSSVQFDEPIEGDTYFNGGITTTANVTANAFFGDGSGLTGVTATLPDNIATTGSNVFIGDQTITGALFVQNGINTQGDVTADKFYGDGSNITNLPTPDLSIYATTGSNAFNGSQVITGSVSGNVGSIPVSSNTGSIDLNLGNFFTLQLISGSDVRIEPSNIKPGQTTNIEVFTTGSGTVSFPSSVLQPSGSSYVPTTTTGKDVITLVSFDSSSLYLVNVKNFI